MPEARLVAPAIGGLAAGPLHAATTHVPVMAALRVLEVTGQYAWLPAPLPDCVVATPVSQRLHAPAVSGSRCRAHEGASVTRVPARA